MNRLQKTLWAILSIVALAFLVLIGISYFDREEMELALGKSFDTSKDWTVTYADGTQETGIDAPYNVPANKASIIVIERELEEDMAGLAMNFEADNAAVRVYVDGMPLTEAGFSFSGSGFQRMLGRAGNRQSVAPSSSTQPDDAEPGEIPPESTGAGANASKSQPGTSTPSASDQDRNQQSWAERNSSQNLVKREERQTKMENAGHVTIDLPNTLKDGSVLQIKLVQIDAPKSIYIKKSNVTQKDAMVIGLLREAIFPLVCCLLMIIAISMLCVMDFARTLFHSKKKGLLRLAFFGVDALVYTFVGTNIMSVLFGNERFFGVLGGLCFCLMPMLLIRYFADGFAEKYPKRVKGLVWLTSLSALAQMISLYFDLFTMKVLTSYSFLLLLLVILMIAYGLWQSGKTVELHIISWVDELALICLLISSVITPLQWSWHETEFFSTVRILGMTGYFLLTTMQQMQMLIREYQDSVKESKRVLEYEVRLVETRNAQLTVAQAEAEAAKQEAIIANEAKGKFLASMSHEIRTPINAVLGMDEMILRESTEPDIRGYAMDIFHSGQTLLSLINDILDLSKIESGKMEIIEGDYDICSMIHDLVNMANVRAKNKDLAFEIHVQEDLPSRYWGDDVRIRQILTNILTNAVKYTPEGTVWFRVSGKRDGAFQILHFEVEDTGIGIKEEDLPKLFEEYQRIEEGRNRNIEGTGLGMNITLRLLSMMDSRLQVDSIYGRGSKFYFDLRQKIMDEVPIGDFEERIKHLADQYTYKKDFIAPEAKILVVDDNSMNRKVFMSLLKPTQIQITEADGGQKAVNLAAKEYFDLIFMDHMMPEMDGVEALHRIRAMEDYPCKDTPIFVLTANAVTGAREQYLADGFDGFLSKPLVAEKLEKTIHDYLPQEKVLPAPEEAPAMGGAGQSGGKDSNGDRWLEELPMIDGLDWQIAWLHLSDKELLTETVRDFYQIINSHADKLQKMYENLPESMSDYRIHVHAMKSTAAMIGIIPLAGMAKILEFAARDENINIIRSLHDVYMAEWKSYREKLLGVFDLGMEQDEDKKEIDPAMVQMLLSLLVDAMEEMDVDEADAAVEKLEAYRFPEEMIKDLEELKAAVADLDSDLVEEVVERMTEKVLAG